MQPKLSEIFMNETMRAILELLDETAGSLTGDIARKVPNIHCGPHANRIHSAWIRQDLLALKQRGLVIELDDQKPVCWCRTEAGSALLGEQN